MTRASEHLDFDRIETYRIQVPGKHGRGREHWGVDVKLAVSPGCDGSVVTTLTGRFDQASLLAMLRRIYAMGIPLLSVAWVDPARRAA